MIITEHIATWGWEHAIRGMRNPLNSWDKSDTIYGEYHGLDENGREILVNYDTPQIGQNDLSLMKRLFKGGTEHRKYLRMIFVSLDITAPLYWWKEFDTYKVGTVANSCSTMHKIASKKFELSDFSIEHLDRESQIALSNVIHVMNSNRQSYNTLKNKNYWWQIIQLLPTSYNQKRTVTMNYENVFTILRQRKGHKLDEWNTFCETLSELPYIEEIGGEKNDL